MVIVGSVLALLCGVLNGVAAAVEKHESLRADSAVAGVRLLARLVQRPPWLAAMGMSALAWVAEAASLALAPVPVVATLRSSGRGLLVVAGGRWLGERFGRTEVAAVVLATAGGVVTAIGTSGSAVSRTALSLADQVVVAALAAGVAFAISRWRSGVALGASVGVLFAATGVFTKQIGDLFASDGWGAVVPVLASLVPWLMITMSIWAQNLLQDAFRKANAASVAAANAAVASVGLVVAGFLLYGEPFPAGAHAGALVAGLAVALTGTVLLAITGRDQAGVGTTAGRLPAASCPPPEARQMRSPKRQG